MPNGTSGLSRNPGDVGGIGNITQIRRPVSKKPIFLATNAPTNGTLLHAVMHPLDFLEFCKAHPGMVTYPEPGDFTGTAFIETLIAGVVGQEQFEQLASMDADKEAVRQIIQPGLDYLKELNPYLWQGGATFPADSTTVGQMFADGELVMNMGYGAPDADIASGALPDTVRSFVFTTGTVGNSNFHAIAANSPHKAAAMVFCNEIMDPEIQLTQYSDLSTITVLDLSKLSAEQQQAFADVQVGVASLPSDLLLEHRVSEAAGATAGHGAVAGTGVGSVKLTQHL